MLYIPSSSQRSLSGGQTDTWRFTFDDNVRLMIDGAEVASYVYPYPSGSRAASSAPVVQPHERAEERLDARAVQRQDLRRAQGRR